MRGEGLSLRLSYPRSAIGATCLLPYAPVGLAAGPSAGSCGCRGRRPRDRHANAPVRACAVAVRARAVGEVRSEWTGLPVPPMPPTGTQTGPTSAGCHLDSSWADHPTQDRSSTRIVATPAASMSARANQTCPSRSRPSLGTIRTLRVAQTRTLGALQAPLGGTRAGNRWTLTPRWPSCGTSRTARGDLLAERAGVIFGFHEEDERDGRWPRRALEAALHIAAGADLTRLTEWIAVGQERAERIR
jgi:hypothetical protein